MQKCNSSQFISFRNVQPKKKHIPFPLRQNQLCTERENVKCDAHKHKKTELIGAIGETTCNVCITAQLSLVCGAGVEVDPVLLCRKRQTRVAQLNFAHQ